MRSDEEDSSAITLVSEDHFFEVTDIVARAVLVLALHWVHDISYRQKASRSLAVIGHFIGLKYKIKSVLALDLISKLETFSQREFRCQFCFFCHVLKLKSWFIKLFSTVFILSMLTFHEDL